MACRTSATTAAMRGAEALVPVKESVQSPSILVVDWERERYSLNKLHRYNTPTHQLFISIGIIKCLGVERVGDSNLGCTVLVVEGLFPGVVSRTDCHGVDTVDIAVSCTRVSIGTSVATGKCIDVAQSTSSLTVSSNVSA